MEQSSGSVRRSEVLDGVRKSFCYVVEEEKYEGWIILNRLRTRTKIRKNTCQQSNSYGQTISSVRFPKHVETFEVRATPTLPFSLSLKSPSTYVTVPVAVTYRALDGARPRARLAESRKRKLKGEGTSMNKFV